MPIEDATSLKEELINEGKTSFVWTGSDNGKIYQLKIENVGTARGIGTYLLIMEDVTKLKQAEADKFHQAEEAIKKLEVNFNQKQLETEELDSSLISKKKELAAKMMQISKRNADLEGILGNLKDLYKQSNSGTKLKLSKIINRLNNSLDIEDGWETFNTYFQEIHPCFLKELKERNNALTNNEVRHCTYIKLGLNNREVAQMLNVAPKTVEVTRYRIKKKLSLSNEESLSTYITAIS